MCRARVLDWRSAARGAPSLLREELAATFRRLAPRWFVTRHTHVSSPPIRLDAVVPRFVDSHE
jgi:hypothetical protein